MDFVTFLIGALATYRLARLVAFEDGPADIFSRFRAWANRKFGGPSNFARGVACPICLSFWFSFVVAALLANNFYFWLTGALAMSGVAAILWKVFK